MFNILYKLWPWGRIKRLRAALDAVTDIGIYPKSVSGGKMPYDERTKYMEGWNAAQKESLRVVLTILKPGDLD